MSVLQSQISALLNSLKRIIRLIRFWSLYANLTPNNIDLRNRDNNFLTF